MRHLPSLLLALAACSSSPESVVPAGSLPSMGDAELPVKDADGKSVAAAIQLLDRSDQDDLQAIAVLRRHFQSAPESLEINVGLARAHARVVDTLDLKNPADRTPHATHRNAARHHAQEALKIDPKSAAAHYWLAAALLYMADAEQSYGRLKEALLELDQAEKLDPKVDFAGPARMKGRIYQETPGFPFLGSKSKAMDFYRKSIEISPAHLLTHLWLAETLKADKKIDEARKEAEKVTQSKPRAGFEKTDGDVQKKAKELLQHLDAK